MLVGVGTVGIEAHCMVGKDSEYRSPLVGVGTVGTEAHCIWWVKTVGIEAH